MIPAAIPLNVINAAQATSSMALNAFLAELTTAKCALKPSHAIPVITATMLRPIDLQHCVINVLKTVRCVLTEPAVNSVPKTTS